MFNASALRLPCVLARVCVLLEELNEAAAASSESSGVGSGGGNWMLVRSGREPPVLWAAGFSEVVNCCSGDGNMLQKTDVRAVTEELNILMRSAGLTMFSNTNSSGNIWTWCIWPVVLLQML